MNEDSARKAEEAADIAKALGVEHRVVTLDWIEGGRRKTDSVARHRRYPALMEQCRDVGANVLMMAHSQDDQIGTVGPSNQDTFKKCPGLGVRGPQISLPHRDSGVSYVKEQWHRGAGRDVSSELLGKLS